MAIGLLLKVVQRHEGQSDCPVEASASAQPGNDTEADLLPGYAGFTIRPRPQPGVHHVGEIR